ncbi:MAG: hypothetical protein WCF67_00675 [Chitinophagaceae bacterium]
MKKLYVLAYSLMILCACVHAQTAPPLNQPADKPLLFAALPGKLECNLEEVDRLFMAEPSQKLSLQLNNQLHLDGTVMEVVRRSPEVLTINFKTSNFSGGLFTISRIIQNGVIRYSGRLISRENGDVLMVVKENDKYYFTKMSQRFVMVE